VSYDPFDKNLDLPPVIQNRANQYFQRFTVAEVRKNKSTQQTDAASWCVAIQRTYDLFLYQHKLPNVTYDARETRARKLGATSYPGALLKTRAHVELAEEILHDNNHPLEGVTIPMAHNPNQLYITKDKEYVVRIGTNSNNEAVVEEKSTGRIFAIKEDLLEKVLPYTVGVRFSTGSQVYHYLSEADQVQQDDLLICTSDGKLSLATVIGVNTKSELANVKLADAFKGVVPITKF
jgi:hypothetical protein